MQSIDRARPRLLAAALAALLSLAFVSGAPAQPPSTTPAATTPAVTTPAPAAAAAATPAAATPAAAKAADPYANGSKWLSLRFGYAKSADENAANGNIGAGFGFTAMGKGMWSVGAFAYLEVLGRYGSASELELPLTLEFARRSHWGVYVRPYLGLGGGAFYHKTYRTGGDSADLRPGFYVLGGLNVPVSEGSMIGFDVRTVFQGPIENADPVFGSGDPDVVHWSAKISWSRIN